MAGPPSDQLRPPPDVDQSIDAAQKAEFGAALASDDAEATLGAAARLSRRDLRGVLVELTPAQVGNLYDLVTDAPLAFLLRELDARDAAEVVKRLDDVRAADVIDEFEPDDAADIMEAIKAKESARFQSILVEMDRAGDIEALLRYLPDTAGGRMTTDFLAVRPSLTAGEAIERVRERARDGQFQSYVYATDETRQLVGVVPLYRLITVDPATPVGSFMRTDPVTVQGSDDQAEVARAIRRYHFLAVPVVDLEGRLMGVVSADDVADIVTDEATSDMFKMAGVGVEERATSPMLQSARRRVPWLAFNMVWSLGAAVIISFFQGTIEQAAVIAVFIPVITGQAGNAGIQTATIVIRSLALGDVTPKDTLSVLLREWGVGAIKGVLFGTLLFLIAWVWKGNLVLGMIAGVSLFANIAIVASTTGVLLPMTLRRLGIDPATIAGVFDTMFSDLMGNLIYLSLATIAISRLA
jgi:magnesium transporter